MKKLASLSIRLNVVMLIIYCFCFQSFTNFESGGEIVEAMELTKEILIQEEWREEERIYNMSKKMPILKSYLKYIDEGTNELANYENHIDELLSKYTISNR